MDTARKAKIWPIRLPRHYSHMNLLVPFYVFSIGSVQLNDKTSNYFPGAQMGHIDEVYG